jgi:hypothetical protein
MPWTGKAKWNTSRLEIPTLIGTPCRVVNWGKLRAGNRRDREVGLCS